MTHYPSQQNQQQGGSYSSFSFPFPPPSQMMVSQQQATNPQSTGQSVDYRSYGSLSNQNSQSSSSPLLPVYYFASPPYLPRPSSYQQQLMQQQQQQHDMRQSMGNQYSVSHLLHHPMSSEDHHGIESMYKMTHQSNSGLSTLASLASGPTPLTPVPRKGKSSVVTVQPKADTMKKKEGLEESAQRIISLLQTRGKMIFKDIHETLGIDYRRAYDILNILLTTTLISKMGKKRENKLPFIYQDGTALPEPVELRDVLSEAQREEDQNTILKHRIALLEEELEKEEATPKFFSQLKERDPTAAGDALYKDLII